MKCPFCRQDNDKVIDSRSSDDGFAIRRRRICLSCERRFTTFERLIEMGVRVIKKNNSLETFDVSKIRSGLQKACWKRPVTEEQIEQIISVVEQQVYSNYENEIESAEIGELVMQELMNVDQVAYVRFASVYREFKDVRDFVDELQPMLKKSRPKTQTP